ncbi:hypothetical protein IGI04_005092, partial [Brassica rapa subsp. trilocularis]
TQRLLIFRTVNSTLCVLSPKSMYDQVVRVIVIQKTLIEHAEKLRQVKAVLEESFSHSREPFEMAQEGNFSGIYRKVQLKPLKWDELFNLLTFNITCHII